MQKIACSNISLFARNFKQMLFHFTEILARFLIYILLIFIYFGFLFLFIKIFDISSLLLPMVNKNSKIRIAALEAMGSVL